MNRIVTNWAGEQECCCCGGNIKRGEKCVVYTPITDDGKNYYTPKECGSCAEIEEATNETK